MNSASYSVKDRIAYITLCRADARNALNDELNRDLREMWGRFDRDESAEVAILRGEGKAFCAGADLKDFIPRWADATFGTLRQNVELGIGGGITRGQHRLYKPIIAAIQGYAVGGGFELALACDIRIAAESAKFGVFEVRKGLHQGDGGLTRLVAIAGAGVALELALTGREVDAREALRLRLVSRVVPDSDLMDSAEQTARQILSNAPSAVRSAKETVMEIIGRPLDDSLRLEALYGYSSFGSGAELKRRLGTK